MDADDDPPLAYSSTLLCRQVFRYQPLPLRSGRGTSRISSQPSASLAHLPAMKHSDCSLLFDGRQSTDDRNRLTFPTKQAPLPKADARLTVTRLCPPCSPMSGLGFQGNPAPIVIEPFATRISVIGGAMLWRPERDISRAAPDMDKKNLPIPGADKTR